MRALALLFFSIALLAVAVAASTLYLYRDPSFACTASAFLDYPFPGKVLSTTGQLTAWPALNLQCTYLLGAGHKVVLTQWAPAGIATVVAPISFVIAMTFAARGRSNQKARQARFA